MIQPGLWLFLLLLFSAVSATALSPNELLEPEKAFRITARALDERSLEVEFRIADGYYMYRDRFSFATASGQPLGEAEIPRGTIKEDQFFGKSEIFRHLVKIRVPVSPEEAGKGSVHLKVTSQGCSDKGVCYTPLEQTVRVSLAGTGSGFDSGAAAPSLHFPIPWLLIFGTLAAALGLGWASAGAPYGPDRTTKLARPAVGVWASVLGVAGAGAGWLGSHFAPPWIAVPLALAYVAMAGLWMYWSMHRGEFSRPVRGARDVALLAAVFLLVFQVGEAWVGASAGLGVGLASGLFPKARTEGVHEPALQAVAMVMVAAAIWVAAPILPDVFRMAAFAAWLVIAGVFMHALDPLPERAPWFARLTKGAGVAALVWGIAVLIGGLSGARDPVRPFEALRAGSGARPLESAAQFERVKTLVELDARIASAGRPVMLDFYADWCVSCKEMEQFTFSDPQVRSRMQRMVLLQVDVTANTPEDKAILKRFRLFGPPGIIFFDAGGAELGQRVIGYQPPERFQRVLDAVLAKEPL